MVKDILPQLITVENNIGNSNRSLSSVTSATTGTRFDFKGITKKTVLIDVSVNTGAVTVNLEVSDDNSNWYLMDATTYAATTGKFALKYDCPTPYIRARTSTQSSSTVSVVIIGSSQ